MLFLSDTNKFSTTFCSSGTNEIILNNLNKRSSLRSNTDSVRLAGIKAAKTKLEEQIKRDATERLHDDIREQD